MKPRFGQTIHFRGYTVDVIADHAQWPETVRRLLEEIPASRVQEVGLQVMRDFETTAKKAAA